MLYKKDKFLAVVIAVIISCCISSCTKTAIEFGSEGVEGDPNVVMIDTFTVDVSTLQLDSFLTGSSSHFVVGSHTDEAIGYIAAKSYFEVTAPTLDLRGCSNCLFDSIVMNVKLSSGYEGDTTLPFTINLHQVTQAMDETEVSIGYNVSDLAYNSSPLGSKTFTVRPTRQDELQVRLPDDFGKDLFRMFKANSDTIANDDQFKRFIKGFCLATSATSNALYYFDKTAADSIIALHYTIAGATPQSKVVYFTISDADHQFNAYSYDKTGKAIAGFTPKKKQLINSKLTGNTGFLHYNSGLFPKIKFNNLLNIKELHPYVQVLRAELDVPPAKGTYGVNSMYTLPTSLEMRETDDDNYINGTPLYFTYGTETYIQNGSLYVDNLYGEKTGYTYDVTNFVNTIISEGAFSKKALIMYPASTNGYSSDQRLLIGNINSTGPVKLKLYILGL